MSRYPETWYMVKEKYPVALKPVQVEEETSQYVTIDGIRHMKETRDTKIVRDIRLAFSLFQEAHSKAVARNRQSMTEAMIHVLDAEPITKEEDDGKV